LQPKKHIKIMVLAGKYALIGGGSAGIGKAVAIALADMGAQVTLMARTEAKLKQALSELPRPLEQKHQYLVVDYGQPEGMIEIVKTHLTAYPAHILINNAGGPPGGPIVKATPQAFLEAIHNHLICNHLLTQAVIDGMKNAAYGRIINIISTSVKEPLDNLGVSNTTRGAVAAWAKTMAQELGPLGINVNNVLPGYTMTDRLEEIIEKRMELAQKTRQEIEDTFKSHVPLRRFAQPKEIADVVAFLASPAASYVHGVSLAVDGGRMRSI
jgi:3-oxoacyl-[acyl-carrier protein] reductase